MGAFLFVLFILLGGHANMSLNISIDKISYIALLGISRGCDSAFYLPFLVNRKYITTDYLCDARLLLTFILHFFVFYYFVS